MYKRQLVDRVVERFGRLGKFARSRLKLQFTLDFRTYFVQCSQRARLDVRQLDDVKMCIRDRFTANQALLRATLGARAGQLGQQIEDFDFPGALASVRALIETIKPP